MLKSVKEYTPSFVVRSVASQLSAEMKRHYKYGTKTLSKKVEKMIEKGQFAGRSSGGSHLERPSYSPFCACECRRRQDCRARRDPRPYQHPSRGGFDPRSYHEKGYFLRGSIKTDGYQLQLLAYKVRELNSVKYKRYHTDLLPDRLLTTTASTGDHLIEVRNVFKSKADVKRLLGCTDDDTDQVSYLDIDLSQAFVVGTYSSIPQDKNPKIGKRRCHRQKKKRGSRGRRNRGSGNCRKKSARALGYLVIGVHEYYTSKKCPRCLQFVAQTKSIRRLYCTYCKKSMHRDVLAGHNIVNILKSHVEKQERPLYL
ncbi:hypothetical protein BGZ58_004460 [Dissophora ornata]|nr:hypothetical protein BGZ58_004460 [Dissophora ornata]